MVDDVVSVVEAITKLLAVTGMLGIAYGTKLERRVDHAGNVRWQLVLR